MARSSSPLPIRHSNSIPRTPNAARHSLLLREPDELATDTVPCSPGFAMRRDDTTQPTQVLSRHTPTLEASSPPSIVEVPASSSPFQPEKRTMLGSRLAPAGTVFRPPPRPQPSSSRLPQKRPAPEPIDLVSDDDDDDDDLLPPRGDIRPTMFKSQISSFAYNPGHDKEKKMREKLRQIFDVYGARFTSTIVRQALEDNDLDVPLAIEWLDKHGSQKPPKAKAAGSAPAPTGRRLINKAALQPAARRSPALSSKTPTPSPPKPAKRRLVQGLKKRGTPSPQKAQPNLPQLPSSDDPLVIDLVDDDDKEDAYEAEQSPSSDDESDDRILTCINSSTSRELAAMTGMKEALLETIVEKRPFKTISQARQVCLDKKPGARKSSKVNIGDSAVSAIEVFLDAVSAIDKVVAKCESQAKMVKGVMDHWDLDVHGHDKRSGQKYSAEDGPPTPTSDTAPKYVKPPVPVQPGLMSTNCQMKPFQLFGLNWMSLLHTYNFGCILADEMGLGKTCQVISLMCHLVESYEDKGPRSVRPWPNLIVVPPSTYNNWLAEFKKFSPGLSVAGYRGSQTERAEIAYEVEQDPEAYHVVLATYSQINSQTDVEAMRACDLHAAIFDEGHKMKNPETKIYRDLRRIPSQWKMLLTGTPVQNNLLEMTSLLSFINPELFDGYMDSIRYIFSTKVSVRDVTNGAFLYSERVKRARTILEPFILQRRKDQVLSDMPQKTCTVVHCDMPDAQKPIYDEYEETFRMEPSQRAVRVSKGRQNDQNNVWMQLRKAAIHPLLFRRHFTDKRVEEMGSILMDRLSQDELHQPDLKHLIQELKNSSDFELHLWCRDYPRLLQKFDYPPEAELASGKVRKLLELIAQYQENGDRVLVFSKFSRVIEILREVLSTKDIDHRVLMGNTNVGERQAMIDEFNQDASIPVFLLTTGAGGTGINLTAANKVVIFDQSDNPQDDIQAENRAHRLGQRRDVEIVRLISTHTIEELVLKACQKKIELAEKVTGAVDDDVDEATAAQNLEKEVRKMMEEQMTPP